MDCEGAKRLLGAWAAGELSGEKAESVGAHVRTCRECAEEAEEYRGMRSALLEAGRSAPQADPSFFSSLSRRLDEADRRMGRAPRPVIRWHFVGAVAAAAAAVFMIAAYISPIGPAAPRATSAPVAKADDPAEPSHPLPSSGSAPSRPWTPYTTVSMQPSARPDQQFDRYGMLAPSPGNYFPRPGLSFGGTNATSADSVSRADYERLQDRMRELETRVHELDAALRAFQQRAVTPEAD